MLERLGCDLVLRRDELGLDGLGEVEMGKRVGAEIRRHFGEDPHIVFEHVGRETFGASVYVVRRGGTVVTCGSSTGYLHEYDNRRLWMRLKRVIGSHAANWQEAWEANRLIGLGRIMPALSRVFPLGAGGGGDSARCSSTATWARSACCAWPSARGLALKIPSCVRRSASGV